MTLESLQERLLALQETTSQLQALITRLGTLKFQPGSAPLDSETDADTETGVVAELSAEIAQLLREEEEDLELLREEMADLRPARPGSDAEHAQARLRDGVRRLDAELTTARAAFRRAQIAARHELEAARRLERALLLASYSAAPPSAPPEEEGGSGTSSPGHQQLFPPGYRPRRPRKHADKGREGEDGGLVEASGSVTAALRRTHALIASELSRSQFARETLAESTAALETLGREYAGLDDMLRSSGELLGTLLKSNKSDTWYLETAFWMLVATLAWLVFRRWVYGPAWWLVWMPVRMVWGTGRGAVGFLAGSGSDRGTGEVRVEVGRGSGKEGKAHGFDEQGRVDVPTVKTGREQVPVNGDDDSMVEKVGRMVDEIKLQVGDRAGNAGEDGGRGDGPNPMKRMWEEDKEAAREASEEARVRDEL